MKYYDKIYELKRNDRCPESLKDKQILRIEVSLKREAFLKKLDLDRDASLSEMLCAGYENGEELLSDYTHKIIPFSGRFVKYDKAKQLIESKITNKSLQEQMLYLIKKTSDSTGVSAATQKLKNHYIDVDDRRIKKIFNAFDKLGISPITMPKK